MAAVGAGGQGPGQLRRRALYLQGSLHRPGPLHPGVRPCLSFNRSHGSVRRQRPWRHSFVAVVMGWCIGLAKVYPRPDMLYESTRVCTFCAPAVSVQGCVFLSSTMGLEKRPRTYGCVSLHVRSPVIGQGVVRGTVYIIVIPPCTLTTLAIECHAHMHATAQAHPNKTLAKELRERDPANYPDDNHKPEMCVTLTDFEGLMGFRPLTEIADALKTHPEIAAAVGKDATDAFIAAVDAAPKDAVDGVCVLTTVCMLCVCARPCCAEP